MPDQPAEQTTVTLKGNQIPLLPDGLQTPSIFADDIRGMIVSNGIAKLGLVQYRLENATNEVKAVQVATLIIPATSVRAWGEYLINNAPKADDAK